jgi:hypothetical protein
MLQGACVKINKETRSVLKKQFDWLPDLLPERVEDFNVQVVDLDTLNVSPWRYGGEGFRVYLLTEGGEKIGEVGRVTLYHRYSLLTRKLFTLLSFGVELKGNDGYHYDKTMFENLEQAIERLQPESWAVQFILHVDGHHATLHKVPRNTTLKDQIEKKKQEQQAGLISFLEQN